MAAYGLFIRDKFLKSVRLFFAFAFSVSASVCAAEPVDIVDGAAKAIEQRDGDALKAMRFTAYDWERNPLSVDELIGIVSACRQIESAARNVSGTRELHFECGEIQASRKRCDGPVLIVALDRATSPDIFAQLRFNRIATPECALPRLPG